ncbi:hypothetical protein T4B_7642 [Trichinella pseudospiralis]|uniref:Uncharacterized protein n=2 Tax=Trichinella pseudospiralis TaxID=6337 RepID=A0A0V0YBC4_TRIPS|nr:hypothetical protein T4E_4813 [Trichinella pseudospiralis]KRY84741.1 hypothetical protein T4D_1056 [Trichinella pseudospiralis]KRZ28192.1 hypothetical protein T4B_7642 [Trichinella pseudospiralis]
MDKLGVLVAAVLLIDIGKHRWRTRLLAALPFPCVLGQHPELWSNK